MLNGSLEIAVAQVEVDGEVPTSEVLEVAGRRVRTQLVAAVNAGARLVQFPEGTLTYPHKRLLSGVSPDLGEADWARVDWGALCRALDGIALCCREVGIWAVVGAPHQLSGGRRPHNSVYVFSADGELVTRYDKRRLSTNEAAYLYTPGTQPVVFDVDGFRFGVAICLEMLFPEIFVEYAAMDVDAVLVASAADPNFARLAAAHALMNAISVSVAFAAGTASDPHRSGIYDASGLIAGCESAEPSLAAGPIPKVPSEPSFHRKARNGLYDAWLAPEDPRSRDRRTI